MKKALTIILSLSLCFCMAALSGCGKQKKQEETAGSIDIEPLTEATQEVTPVSGDWKAAYLDILQADKNMINDYTRFASSSTSESSSQSKNVALTDLNGDGTPELMYFVRDPGQMFPYMKVYTFTGNSAQKVTYSCPPAHNVKDDLPTDAFYDYEVQGGTYFTAYLNEDGSIQLYNFTFGATSSNGTMNRFKMGSDGKLQPTERFGFVDGFLAADTENSGDAEVSYWNNGKEIQESEYSSMCSKAATGIKQVIFSTAHASSVEEDSIFWDKAKGRTPAAVTYDEAVKQLGQ